MPPSAPGHPSDGTPALLCHCGHALMESQRHRLWLDIALAVANGHVERAMAENLLRRFRRRHTSDPDPGETYTEFLYKRKIEIEHRRPHRLNLEAERG